MMTAVAEWLLEAQAAARQDPATERLAQLVGVVALGRVATDGCAGAVERLLRAGAVPSAEDSRRTGGD